jgi:hypothetical protein
MIPIQALIHWVLNHGNKHEKQMAREAEVALENVHKQLVEYHSHIARLQAIEAAAREVLERFEWYKKLAEEGKGVSDSGYLSVSVMTLWDKQDQLAYDALATELTRQPGDGRRGVVPG